EFQDGHAQCRNQFSTHELGKEGWSRCSLRFGYGLRSAQRSKRVAGCFMYPAHARDVLTPQRQSVFAPVCPDFVIELCSPTDTVKEIKFKLEEYVANGAKLGFLIYPPQQQVFVYRPGQNLQCLQQPSVVSADPELPGFTLDLTEIWQ